MKRFFAIILSALILTSFAACNNNSATETNTSKAEGGTSSSTSESGNKSSSDSNSGSKVSSETDSSSSKSESKSSETASSSETSNTNKLSNASMAKAAGALLKDGLHNFFVELDEDKYRLEIDMSTTTSDKSKIVIITREGNDISAATGDSKDNLSKSIIKDNKGYVIDDTEKTVTWSEFEEGYAENYTEYLAQLFYITDIEMIKSGKEKFGDKEMEYEEYKILASSSSSTSSDASKAEEQHVRYYFDNKEFKGMKIINGNDYYSLRIASMTHEIPNGEFDYPSNYKLVQAKEYSYTIDGSSSAESSKS
ncbi:MAG: hypothetical protein SOT80_08725 [Candidatus Pseudoruminococcus sp.]|uniref:hypothetical protein n=1 Tax=Candidatus Pseudoruminococcus sp. TaxID=3101048 RepID=UPI002A79D007|nr:hypothetical protein [Ruminococcus sp.]MDY2783459.1 hypothetical protein [Candidatus Pseudoruminococcus sp.]